MLWFSGWVAKIRDFQRYRERWTTSWLHQKKTKSLYWKVSQVVELRPIQHHALILTCVTEFNIRDCGCLEEIFESNDRMVKYEPLVSLPQLDHIYSEKSWSDFRLTKFTKDKYQAMSWVEICVSWCFHGHKPSKFVSSLCEWMQEVGWKRSSRILFFYKKNDMRLRSYSQCWALENLPSIKCFYRSSSPYCVELPKCSHIKIEDCRVMKSFWYNGTLYTPYLAQFIVIKTGNEETKWKMYLPNDDY